jgi:hypothetical protein
MSTIDEAELQITEQRVTDVVRSVERNSREPTELWARIERELDRSRQRRRWFRLTLAAAAAVAVVAGAVWQVGDRDRHTVSTGPGGQSTRTIEAACRSLLSMRQDLIPLPDDRHALRFTIRRMHATYALAATALDSVEAVETAPSMRDALQAWQSIFELDARHRLDQAAIDINEVSLTAVKQDVGGSLVMTVAAVTELHDAGIAACDPNP